MKKISEVEKLLKDWNGGVLREAKTRLAKELKVQTGNVSNWENDNIQPSIEMLVKIARVFNVSTDFLLGQDDHTYIEVTNLTKTQIRHIQQIINDIVGS